MANKKVVYLVDNKRRDLAMASLIAFQLERLGIQCQLEPLESYRAVLGADKPDLIIFNHLLASHLVAYSKRLNKFGVKTAVLPNEGIIYKEEVLGFNAGRFHNGAHIDIFFAWNKPFESALKKAELSAETSIELVGIPRFDYYFQPWSKRYALASTGGVKKHKVLVCTNFVFAKYGDLPDAEAHELFKDWARRIPVYQDYLGAVKVSHKNRDQLFAYLDKLLLDDRFEVTLRPHPNEEIAWYQKKISMFNRDQRSRLTLDTESNITSLILDCDIEVSMDSCTTALESWIAGKPTVDLHLDRHPLLSNPELDSLNQRCSDPNLITDLLIRELQKPSQEEFSQLRKQHLEKWCNSPSGNSSEMVAIAVEKCIKNSTKNIKLNFSDQRRALKLRILRAINKPYNWQPQLTIKALFSPQGTFIKRRIFAKTIFPNDAKLELGFLRSLFLK